MDVPGLNCVSPVTLKVMLMLKRQPCTDLIPAAAALTAEDEHVNETVVQHGHLAGDEHGNETVAQREHLAVAGH